MLERRGQALGFTIALLSLARTGLQLAAAETALGIVAVAILDGLGGLIARARLRADPRCGQSRLRGLSTEVAYNAIQ